MDTHYYSLKFSNHHRKYILYETWNLYYKILMRMCIKINRDKILVLNVYIFILLFIFFLFFCYSILHTYTLQFIYLALIDLFSIYTYFQIYMI
jgi:hypothetical protein